MYKLGSKVSSYGRVLSHFIICMKTLNYIFASDSFQETIYATDLKYRSKSCETRVKHTSLLAWNINDFNKLEFLIHQ